MSISLYIFESQPTCNFTTCSCHFRFGCSGFASGGFSFFWFLLLVPNSSDSGPRSVSPWAPTYFRSQFFSSAEFQTNILCFHTKQIESNNQTNDCSTNIVETIPNISPLRKHNLNHCLARYWICTSDSLYPKDEYPDIWGRRPPEGITITINDFVLQGVEVGSQNRWKIASRANLR